MGSRASSHAAVPLFPSPIEHPPPLRVVSTVMASVGFAVGEGCGVGVDGSSPHTLLSPETLGIHCSGNSQSEFLLHVAPCPSGPVQIPMKPVMSHRFGSVQLASLQQTLSMQAFEAQSPGLTQSFPMLFCVGVGVGNCVHVPSLPETRQDSPLGHTALSQQTPSLPQNRPGWHCEALVQIVPASPGVAVRVAVAVGVAVDVGAGAHLLPEPQYPVWQSEFTPQCSPMPAWVWHCPGKLVILQNWPLGHEA